MADSVAGRLTARTEGPLKLALPRGALFGETLDTLDAIGVDTSELRGDSRSLVFETSGLVLVTMRPSDVPTYVEAGAADVGITGKDVLMEQADRVTYELLDLRYGSCRMVLAGRKGDERLAEVERRLGAMRIATKYPRIAERYFEQAGRAAEVIEVKGSVELAPLVGLADGIVDLVDTGRTLAENDLEVRQEIAVSTARLVANRVAHKLRAEEVDDLVERFREGDMGLRIERIEWDGREASALAGRLRSLAPGLSEVSADVAEILGAVRTRGDDAIRELALRFDEPAPESLRIDPEAVEAAPGLLDPEVRDALRAAAKNIAEVARAELNQVSSPAIAELPEGQRVELRSEPVPYAGIYAPGGKASYPSSLLMCAIPAQVAGVGRLAVASPPASASARPSTAVLAACAIAGVTEVYAIGGAQAIAAFAFGTETVPRVDVIAGPGNRYVTEAKRIVSGQVGIDGVAGPSELAIVADASADPRLLALDLCAQAEHGDDSLLLLVSPDGTLLDEVAEQVEGLAQNRSTVASPALALVEAPGVQRALELSDAFAPEHLQLAFDGADDISARSRLAGCVFVGSGAATAFGDYAAGSNHVLPTGGAARFGGPLGPRTFMRRASVVTMPARAAEALAPTVDVIARAEGLPVHGESALARTLGDSRE